MTACQAGTKVNFKIAEHDAGPQYPIHVIARDGPQYLLQGLILYKGCVLYDSFLAT